MCVYSLNECLQFCVCLLMVESVFLSVCKCLCMAVYVYVCLWGVRMGVGVFMGVCVYMHVCVCVCTVGREGPVVWEWKVFSSPLQTFVSPQTPSWSDLGGPEHQGKWGCLLLIGPAPLPLPLSPLSGPPISPTPQTCLLSSSPFLLCFFFLLSSSFLFQEKRGEL